MIAAVPSSPILPATGVDKPAEPAAGSIEALFAALIAHAAVPPNPAPPIPGDAPAKAAAPADDDSSTDADATVLPNLGQPIDPLAGLSAFAALIAASQPAPVVADNLPAPPSVPATSAKGAAPVAPPPSPPIVPAEAAAKPGEPTTPAAPVSADRIAAAMEALKAAVSNASTDPTVAKVAGGLESAAIVQPAGAPSLPLPQSQTTPAPPAPPHTVAEVPPRPMAAEPAAKPIAVADAPHVKPSRNRSRGDLSPAVVDARIERMPDLPAGANPVALPSAATPVNIASAGSAPAPIADTLGQHRLDLAHDGAWLDRLALDIAQSAASDRQLRFQLNPEHLGALHVELSRGGEGTSVRLSAETDAARTILADAQPRLIAEARAQGLRIADTHVDLAGRGDGQRQAPVQPEALVRTVRAATELESPAPQRGRQERYA